MYAVFFLFSFFFFSFLQMHSPIPIIQMICQFSQLCKCPKPSPTLWGFRSVQKCAHVILRADPLQSADTSFPLQARPLVPPSCP